MAGAGFFGILNPSLERGCVAVFGDGCAAGFAAADDFGSFPDLGFFAGFAVRGLPVLTSGARSVFVTVGFAGFAGFGVFSCFLKKKMDRCLHREGEETRTFVVRMNN